MASLPSAPFLALTHWPLKASVDGCFMKRRSLLGLLALPGMLSLSFAATMVPKPASLEVGTGQRLMVVAPHPDDETLGAGGLVQRVLERGGSVLVVLVTAGDGYRQAVTDETGKPQPSPSQYIAYGKLRLREAHATLRKLGQRHLRLQFLGFPDGGLDQLLRTHWRRRHPERSPTTGASDPPYANALEPDVPYDGSDLRRELARLLRETHPTIVALPDPLDEHPDHRATGIFTLLALNDWLGATSKPKTAKRRVAIPQLVTYLIHWKNWPPDWNANTPVPDASNASLDLPQDLPPRGLACTALTLTDKEVETKRVALAQYVSQQKEMAPFLVAFVRRTEPFTVISEAELRRMAAMTTLPGKAKKTRRTS
jgi:LmbE family N-acetylglucosaminyl deacetylase